MSREARCGRASHRTVPRSRGASRRSTESAFGASRRPRGRPCPAVYIGGPDRPWRPLQAATCRIRQHFSAIGAPLGTGGRLWRSTDSSALNGAPPAPVTTLRPRPRRPATPPARSRPTAPPPTRRHGGLPDHHQRSAQPEHPAPESPCALMRSTSMQDGQRPFRRTQCGPRSAPDCRSACRCVP